MWLAIFLKLKEQFLTSINFNLVTENLKTFVLSYLLYCMDENENQIK
jgi:hypothetical protein